VNTNPDTARDFKGQKVVEYTRTPVNQYIVPGTAGPWSQTQWGSSAGPSHFGYPAAPQYNSSYAAPTVALSRQFGVVQEKAPNGQWRDVGRTDFAQDVDHPRDHWLGNYTTGRGVFHADVGYYSTPTHADFAAITKVQGTMAAPIHAYGSAPPAKRFEWDRVVPQGW
jgi:hypothetical protein